MTAVACNICHRTMITHTRARSHAHGSVDVVATEIVSSRKRDGMLYRALISIVPSYRVPTSLGPYDIRTDARTDGLMDRRTDGRTDGRTDERTKISDFCENIGFLRKSRICAKILHFCENLRFLRKSEIFV